LLSASRPDARSLLPAPARLPAAALVAACVVVTVVLGLLVAGQHQAGTADARIDAALQARLAGHVRAVEAMIALGNVLPSTIVTVAIAVICLAARRYRGALLVVAIPLAVSLTEYALKPLFGRTLAGLYAYPSGHVTVAAAIVMTVVVLLTGPGRLPLPAPLRLLLVAAALAELTAVAVGVVAAGMHYATDTFGGAAVGTGTVLAAALALDWLGARWRAAAPPPAEEDRAGAGMTAAARGLPRA
jgi:membrane-associated phospholipid phosphatase